MKIGIDFDDVTVDFINNLVKWHNEKYKTKNKLSDLNQFYWGPFWGTDRQETIRRVDEFLETHDVKDINPIKGAIDSINKLSEKNELFVITGRPLRFKNKTEEWLIHHLKRKLEVIHAGEFHKGQAATKAEICKEKGISILLEDAPETSMDCANKGIKVVLFDMPWNQKVKHFNITRVFGWKEAMKVIEELEKSK